jgi:hypothetical protein
MLMCSVAVHILSKNHEINLEDENNFTMEWNSLTVARLLYFNANEPLCATLPEARCHVKLMLLLNENNLEIKLNH